MKQLAALAWKEWHETRIYLWIAIGVFIGLPVIGGFEAIFQHISHAFEISTTPWVVIFGGVLAVFVAVGATCRDYNGRLEDFWRSRPVGVGRWLLVKYLVGLAVVLASCILPLLVELCFTPAPDRDAWPITAWFPFMWAASYSIGFLAGCLLRRTAHAAMLALAGMLLLWFLPLVLPPLRWMSVTKISDNWGWDADRPRIFNLGSIEFGASMAGLAVVVTGLAILAAKRNWRIEAGRKMMYGSVSAALLILLASAAFQLGTNLPILQQLDLPDGPGVMLIRCDGTHGIIVTDQSRLLANDQYFREYKLRTFDLTPSGIVLGSTSEESPFFPYWQEREVAWAPGHLDIQYLTNTNGDGQDPSDGKFEQTLQVNPTFMGFNDHSIFLWEDLASVLHGTPITPIPYVHDNRLYVVGTHLSVFDITDPLKPKLISTTPFNFFGGPLYSDYGQVVFPLPALPDLSPSERLELAVKSSYWVNAKAFDGEFLCFEDDNGVFACRLDKSTEKTAEFKNIGQYKPSILESVFGMARYSRLNLANGLLYMSNYSNVSNSVNPSISVFELGGQPGLRLAGHFAAPGANIVFPLPDGRAIVGGSKLWLVGPPPGWGAK